MSKRHPHLQIVRDTLRMIDGDDSPPKELGLDPEELDKYRKHVLGAGLVEVVTDTGERRLLRVTPRGKALLHLMDSLEACGERNVAVGQGQTARDRVTANVQAKEKTLRSLRGRLLQAYVLEQAEATRLETQLRAEGEVNEEARVELAQRQRRLDIIGSLLDTLNRLQERMQG